MTDAKDYCPQCRYPLNLQKAAPAPLSCPRCNQTLDLASGCVGSCLSCAAATIMKKHDSSCGSGVSSCATSFPETKTAAGQAKSAENSPAKGLKALLQRFFMYDDS